MSIQHMQHDHPGLKYLEAILIFCRKAIRKGREKQSGKAQTFMACIQSMTAIPELAKHLLERQSWFSVLLNWKADVCFFRRTLWMVPSQ